MPFASNPAMRGRLLGELLAPGDRQPWRSALARAAEPLRAHAVEQPLSFREYITRTDPRFVWYDHCERLVAVLQRVVDGELANVLIAAPPRHGKSEIVSRKLPAYFLYRFPDRWAALSSYAAELAYTLSRNARDTYVRGGGRLRDDAAAVKHWETVGGGGLWAAGFGGPATGKGFHLGIIDDPIKNAEEAASEAIGRRNRDWYRSTWSTRAEPGAAKVIMQTRWPGPGDMIGFLFEEEEAAEDEPERWHVVSLEAVKEREPLPIPATCTRESDPRSPGEALCPPRYPIEKLRAIETRVGPFYFAALFQQRPRPRGGGMFPREQAVIVEAAPAGIRWLRWWDFGATKGGGDPTAGAKVGVHEGRVYIGHVARAQLEAHERDQLIKQTAELDGRSVTQWGEQEPGSGGKAQAAAFVRLLAGWPVHTEPTTGDKPTAADPLAAQWQAGNVRLVHGTWNAAFLDEAEAFPFGPHDDQIEAASRAYNKLVSAPRRAPQYTSTSHITSR